MAAPMSTCIRLSKRVPFSWKQVRRYSVKEGFSNDIGSVPLSKSVPWLPLPRYATSSKSSASGQISTLDNGLRIATEPNFGEFCTLGVLIDSGSRYEVNHTSGITHFLEKLAFGATSKYKSRDEIMHLLEQHSGICDCQGSRDTIIYATSVTKEGVPSIVEMLSEVILRPQLTDAELDMAQQAVEFELESLNMNPNPETLLTEMIHAAAYRDNSLGLPKVCPSQNTAVIRRPEIYTFLNNIHTPERMVLAAVGVDHQQLVDLAQKHFVQQTPVWQEKTDLLDTRKTADRSLAQYTGGQCNIEKDLSNVSLGPNPMPHLAHVVLALESSSHKDSDFIAFCVLNMMLGGGGSFSAGGPGKGMYTRLYTNVLNRHHWIHNATAYNHAYEDSGIFCIHAAAHPSALQHLVEIAVHELAITQRGTQPVELERAKTQLQSMLLMNLEVRPVMFEDLGRQVLSNRKRHPAQYYYDLIAKITDDDIKRVARRMLSSAVSVAAYGELNTLPAVGDIRDALQSRDGKLSRRFSLFR